MGVGYLLGFRQTETPIFRISRLLLETALHHHPKREIKFEFTHALLKKCRYVVLSPGYCRRARVCEQLRDWVWEDDGEEEKEVMQWCTRPSREDMEAGKMGDIWRGWGLEVGTDWSGETAGMGLGWRCRRTVEGSSWFM